MTDHNTEGYSSLSHLHLEFSDSGRDFYLGLDCPKFADHFIIGI